ncbi:MAG: YitT family protein [Clostridia bacterium]|nr:YitT family protein [Clostridia bacterium]
MKINKDKLKLKFDPKEDLITLGLLCVCAFIQGLAISLFYEPNELVSMGIGGISLMVKYLFDIPPAITIIVLNIPIIIVAVFVLDLKTTIINLAGTFIFAGGLHLAEMVSVNFIDFFKMDTVLAGIAGGAILGIAYAPIAKRNATFGGMDIVALMINKKLSISMGTFNILYNIVIMVSLVIIMDAEIAAMSILAMFTCNVAFDYTMRGLNRTNTVFIISDKWEEISKHIMTDVNRGLTYINGEGAYTHAEKRIIYCIVRTMEIAKLRDVVMQYDPHAMFSVIDTKEVDGRGFGTFS